MAEWLAARVGPTGQVVATDLETKFLETIEAPNLEVRKHSVVSDPIETNHYNLIHSRAVLEHIPARDEIVPRLVGALRQGGWLTLESGDLSTVRMVGGKQSDAEFFDRAFATMIEVSQTFGADMTYGRRLGVVMRDAGLEHVVVEGYITEWDCDHPIASLYDLTFQRLQGPALERAAISESDLNRLFSMLRSSELRALSHIVYAARGQRER